MRLTFLLYYLLVSRLLIYCKEVHRFRYFINLRKQPTFRDPTEGCLAKWRPGILGCPPKNELCLVEICINILIHVVWKSMKTGVTVVTFGLKGHKLYCLGDIILVMKMKAIAARPMVQCDLFSMHWFWLWLVYKVFLPIMCESHASGLKTAISRIKDNFSCQTHQFERIVF